MITRALISFILLITMHIVSGDPNDPYNTVQDGPFDVSSTWAGGNIPPQDALWQGQTVNINHDVTHSGNLFFQGVDALVNISDDASLHVTGQLRVANEMNFHVDGTIQTGTNFLWETDMTNSSFTGDATIITGNNLDINIGQFSPSSLQATIGNDMVINGTDIDIGPGLITIENDHRLTGGNTVNIDAEMDIGRDLSITNGPTTVYNGLVNIGRDLIKDGGSSMSFYSDLIVTGDTDLNSGEGGEIDFYIGPDAYYTTANYISTQGFDTRIDGEMDVRDGIIDMESGGVIDGNGIVGWDSFTATSSRLECADGTYYGNTSGSSGSVPPHNPIDLSTCGPGNFVLPVTFTTLTATQGSNATLIEWGTAVEKNNDRFEIQKSKTGHTFETIGTVQGAGNSAETLSYTFEDYEKNRSTVYYRIKQIDFDSEYSYSDVIHTAAPKSDVVVSPNPVKAGARLDIHHDEALTYYSLSTSQGDVVQQGDLQTNTITLPESIIPGLYILRIKTTNGFATQRIMVQ